MKEIHKILLDIMDDFHRVCAENNITYYMLGGTMLGAIRHKGFIPWDDDMDVGVPREEYNKLISIFNKKCSDKYILKAYENDKKHKYLFAKVYDRTTTVVEDNDQYNVGGVFLDIFPLDNLSGDYNSVCSKINKLQLVRRVLIIRNKFRIKPRNIKTFFVKIVSYLLNTFLPKRVIFKIVKSVITEDNTKYIANCFGAWGIKEIAKRETFGTPKLYNFESANFYGVENPHKYLSDLYGDYMTPPKNIQESHRKLYENFNKSYEEFSLKELLNE